MSADGWYVGRIGGMILIRIVRHGGMTVEGLFSYEEAEILTTNILREMSLLRPLPPQGPVGPAIGPVGPTAKLRVVK